MSHVTMYQQEGVCLGVRLQAKLQQGSVVNV